MVKTTIRRLLLEYRKELVAVLVLFSVALGLRLLYQGESIVDHPIRADAAKYYRAAYNLRHFGVYSLDPPREDLTPPESRTDLSPGYPIFLSLLMTDGILQDRAEFVARVLHVQAILGSLVAVFTFLIARLCLKFSWAVFAGTLTALSPHLIAIDGFVLTESLFTFVLMLGALLLSVSWRTNYFPLTLIASLLLVVSAKIRAVSYLLVFLLAAVFLLDPRERSPSRKAIWIRHFVCLVLGFLIVAGIHRGFVKLTVTHESGIFNLASGKSREHERREAPQQYVVFSSPWAYLKKAVRPPKFFVEGNSHVLRAHGDPNWKVPTKASFREEPIAYLKWNLGGRLPVMWHWDNSYNGDVYIYPMVRSGFRENSLLKLVHVSMYVLHWPLFCLTIIAPIVLFVQWRKRTLAAESSLLLVPLLGFAYFIAVLWVLNWLPRYTIPVRPFSYVLAAFSLSSVAGAWGKARAPWASGSSARSQTPHDRRRRNKREKEKQRRKGGGRK